MLGPLDGHRPQGLPSSLHRRRLGPLVCLVISILLVWSLVRFDPHTNAAVGKAGERLAEGWRDRYKAGLDGGWDAWKAATKGWAGAVAPAAGGLEGPETGQMVDAPPAGWRQGKPLAEGADLEGCREPTPPKLPTTKLGRVADRVYDSIGTLCLDTYRSELETFLLAHFPSPAANLSDPGSLYSLLRSYLNATLVTLPPSSPLRENLSGPGIPKKIHQTNRLKEYRPAYLLSTQVWDPWSWEQKNPDWEYEMVVDSDADSWVRKTFSEPRAQPPSSGKLRLDDPPSSRSGVVDAWDRMASTPVMRSDFWRYLRLLSLGGTYSDMDTRCLKPIAEWTRWGGAPAGADGDWAAGKATGEPSVVVGIEADVGNREDWHEWWPRPIQIVQWTMSASPGHPILLDTLRRVLGSFASLRKGVLPSDADADGPGGSDEKHVMSVVELTGPGPFTDAVLRYLGVMTEGKIRWRHLRSLPEEGVRIGDVLVLPITAFSPGVGHMNAGEISDDGAYVQHGFAGTWKSKPSERRQ